MAPIIRAEINLASRTLGTVGALVNRIRSGVFAAPSIALAQACARQDINVGIERSGLFVPNGDDKISVYGSAAAGSMLSRAGVSNLFLGADSAPVDIHRTMYTLATRNPIFAQRALSGIADIGIEVSEGVKMPFTWGEFYQDKNPYVPPNIGRYAGLGCTSSAATILGIALMCSETVRNDQETLTPIILALATGLVSLPILGMIANSAIKKTIWHIMSIYPISPSAVRNSYDDLTRDWENYAVGKLSETETAEMIFGLPKTNPTKITWQQCIVGERYKGEGYIYHPDYSTEKGPIYESIMGYRTEAESRYAEEDFQRAGTIINMAPLNTRADILLALEHLDFYLARGARPHVRLSEG
ncbi:MAG: hypothetical protein WC490_05050 [Candidatus Margulisiibacteriota bacterium]